MFGRRHTPLLAFGLCVLFLFTIIPGDLLHDHDHGATAHQNEHADHDRIAIDCSICDMVLPVRSDDILLFSTPIRSLVQVGAMGLTDHVLDGLGIFHADRGPPFGFNF